MALAPLTAQLPSLTGALPDLFRRPDASVHRDDGTGASQTAAGDPSGADTHRALDARAPDDTTRLLARRATLGPLTYGRRTPAPDASPAVPIGMRGAHLDVRG